MVRCWMYFEETVLTVLADKVDFASNIFVSLGRNSIRFNDAYAIQTSSLHYNL